MSEGSETASKAPPPLPDSRFFRALRWFWQPRVVHFVLWPWAAGLFLGFIPTAPSHLTPSNWPLWGTARLLVHLGMNVFMGLMIYAIGATPKLRLRGALVFWLLGAALSFNCVLALARGPQIILGTVVDYRLQAQRHRRGTREIHKLRIMTPAGNEQVLNIDESDCAREVVEGLDEHIYVGQTVRLTYLPHLARYLAIETAVSY